MAARDLRTRFFRRASKAGLFVPDDLAERLVMFYELLARWNRKINLTALDDPDAAIDRLLLEPIAAARHLQATATSLMDIGSGGGSPAIPLRLTAPQLALTMVESKARKAAFLSEAIRHLELHNSRVETSRYEELLVRPELHECFHVLSLRAVRVDQRVLTSLQAFVRQGGTIFLFRGPGGPDALTSLFPPLQWRATHSLIESLQSRLSIVEKLTVGSGTVPRGT